MDIRNAALSVLGCWALVAFSGLAAETTEVNTAYEPLAWLIGEWRSEFHPKGDDLPAATMGFRWGNENHGFLVMTGTRPTPDGSLVPEYETMVVWHLVKRRFVFLGVLPVVVTFFFAFGVLEDSGYLPRLAVVVNRLFRAMGLNGKAVLPMVLGLGCDTMATLTARILETRKDTTPPRPDREFA